MNYKFSKSLLFLFLLVLSYGITSCGGNTEQTPPPPTKQIADVHPKTPEEVIRRYQACLDSNLFDRAQSLSTPRSAPLHEMMAAIVADTPSDSSLIHTEFISLDCTPGQDTMVCNCLLRDEYEEYLSEYILVKVEGLWFVDIPDEEDDLEFFEKEMLEEWPEKE